MQATGRGVTTIVVAPIDLIGYIVATNATLLVVLTFLTFSVTICTTVEVLATSISNNRLNFPDECSVTGLLSATLAHYTTPLVRGFERRDRCCKRIYGNLGVYSAIFIAGELARKHPGRGLEWRYRISI